jgi:hypothetical protein
VRFLSDPLPDCPKEHKRLHGLPRVTESRWYHLAPVAAAGCRSTCQNFISLCSFSWGSHTCIQGQTGLAGSGGACCSGVHVLAYGSIPPAFPMGRCGGLRLVTRARQPSSTVPRTQHCHWHDIRCQSSGGIGGARACAVLSSGRKSRWILSETFGM